MTEPNGNEPVLKTPLQLIKEVRDKQIRLHGLDSLSVRKLTAEITSYERALEKRTQTQAEQYRGHPMK